MFWYANYYTIVAHHLMPLADDTSKLVEVIRQDGKKPLPPEEVNRE